MRRTNTNPAVSTWSLYAIAVMVLSTAVAFLPVPAFAQTLTKGSEAAGRERPLEIVKASFARVMFRLS